MKIYFAPLEGVTGHIYRNAYEEFYGKGRIDKYFVPFISPNQTNGFTAREQRDMNPDNNVNMPLAVQIMTNRADLFINAARLLYEKGYTELNLNLGCPSGTVVAKKRGAGFLSVPDELDEFFAQIYENELLADKKVKLSVKTRLGMEEPEEFDRLLDIYNRYPFEELILHPRVQKDYYKNKPRLEYFEKALEKSTNPVCYNGDLITERDVSTVSERYPDLPAVMIGRALIADPSLVMRLTGGKAADAKMLETFHDTLFVRYCEAFGDSRIAMLRMKEIWFYHLNLFENSEKTGKAIKKAKNAAEFQAAAAAVFRDCRVRANAVPLWFKLA